MGWIKAPKVHQHNYPKQMHNLDKIGSYWQCDGCGDVFEAVGHTWRGDAKEDLWDITWKRV